MSLIRWLPFAITLLGMVATAAHAAPRAPETRRIRVDAGSALQVQLLHLAPAAAVAGRAPVLFVHGATFPSALAAAYRLRGLSWMDDLAAHGFDVWALDFLGYGGSDRYPEMSEPSTTSGPVGRTAAAAEQILAAVRFIRGVTAAARVSVVAHSWGTLPAGAFAAAHGDLIERLVLFGPLVDRHPEPASDPAAALLPATAEITRQDQRENFDLGVPAGAVAPFDGADFASWADLYLANGRDDAVRVPYGPLADARDADAGVLPYSPAAIHAPTLLVRGSWDAVSTAADLESLFARLGAPLRRAVTLAGGTHRMHLETGRLQLFREVEAFLAGGDKETP